LLFRFLTYIGEVNDKYSFTAQRTFCIDNAIIILMVGSPGGLDGATNQK